MADSADKMELGLWEPVVRNSTSMKRKSSKLSDGEPSQKATKEAVTPKISNKFDLLENLQDSNPTRVHMDTNDANSITSDNESEVTELKSNSKSPLPITVKSEIEDLQELLKALNARMCVSPTLKINNGLYTFKPHSTQDHAVLVQMFTNNKLNFHTYAAKEGKPLKMLIKGLPNCRHHRSPA